MNDRELLELAAKAAGLRVVDRSAPVSLYIENASSFGGVHWNPLTNDGDALRLATKLRIDLEYMEDSDTVYARYGSKYAFDSLDDFGVRRAIVKVAAEIGKQT